MQMTRTWQMGISARGKRSALELVSMSIDASLYRHSAGVSDGCTGRTSLAAQKPSRSEVANLL